MNSKWRNYGLWVAVASLLGMFLSDLFDMNGLPFVPEKYDFYVKSILSILVLAGVISNPSQGQGFKDDKIDM